MKSAKIVTALSAMVAAMALAATANAAVYNMTVNSGTYKVDDGLLGVFSIDLAGRWVSIDVSDTFEEITIYYGGGTYETGMFKTATVSDVVNSKLMTHTTGPSPLYSADGVNFFYDLSFGHRGWYIATRP